MLGICGRYCRPTVMHLRHHGVLSPFRGFGPICFAKGRAFLEKILEPGLEAVFPGLCCHCGQLFRSAETRWADCPAAHRSSSRDSFDGLLGAYLCKRCAGLVRAVDSPMCLCCGQPFGSSTGIDHLCAQCENHSVHYQAARAAGYYETALRSLIQAYKYQAQVHLAVPLGRLLWQTLTAYWDPAAFDAVIPVPLHSRRLRRRGFNQAELLLGRWPGYAREVGFDPDRQWIERRALKRVKLTQSQTGLDKEQRQANLYQAFSIAFTGVVQGRHLLLVDDVLTTGATADACAWTLMTAGASSVKVLTLARVD